MLQKAKIQALRRNKHVYANQKTIGFRARRASALSLLAACGTTPSSTAQTGSSASGGAAAEPVTLTFWRAGTDVETETYWNAMIARFEAEHPGVTVELSSLPWGDEIETKLNPAYVRGTAPDILS